MSLSRSLSKLWFLGSENTLVLFEILEKGDTALLVIDILVFLNFDVKGTGL